MAKYSKAAQKKVERAMHEEKRGQLRSGRSGKKVTNPRQAIAIGLSEARKAGAKVPPAGKKAAKKSAAKKSARKTAKKSSSRSTGRKSAAKKTSRKRSTQTSKRSAPKKKGAKKSSRSGR